MVTTPANWYDDPFVDGQQRYWDGRQWTERIRRSSRRGTPWSDGVLLALIVAGAIGILALTDRPSAWTGLALFAAVGLAVTSVIQRNQRQP